MSQPFDAFISYAHEASDNGAKALKQGIEQFNRPWNKARSTKVFLDDSSMSASASLEGTITEALSEARWLIVMLSEAAALSPWVNKEVAWWLDNRDADHLLLVHNDGVACWSDGFSPDSTAIPPAMRRLNREPRWIDMRWFDAADSLGIQDPRLLDVVLQLYCPIHGLDREEAVSQRDANVRKARRLTAATIASLSVLLIATIIASLVAVQQRGAALSHLRAATGRQLAARGSQLLATEIGTARLLTAEGWGLLDDTETRRALLAAATSSPQLNGQVVFPDEVSEFWASQDRTVTVALANGDLQQWRAGSRKVTQIGHLDETAEGVTSSDDGAIVGAWYPHDGGDNGFTEVALFSGGERLDLPGASEGPIVISPSGQNAVYFVDQTREHTIMSPNEGEYEVHLVTITSGQLTEDRHLGVVNHLPHELRWGDNGRLVMLYNPDIGAGSVSIEVSTWRLDPLTKQTWSALGYGEGFEFGGTLSTGGEYVFTGAEVVDATADSPESSTEHPAHGTPVSGAGGGDGSTAVGLAVSPDGSRVVSAVESQLHVVNVGGLAGDTITIPGSRTLGDVALPDPDHVVSVDGDLVSLWTLSTEHSLVSVHELVGLDIGCGAKNCVPTQVIPNADGSLVVIGASNGFWLYRPGTRDLTQIAGHFLDWKDIESYFASATVNGEFEIQLYDAGRKHPTRAWPLPGLTPGEPDGIQTGAWQASANQFVAIATNSDLQLKPGERYPTWTFTSSIVRLKPDEPTVTVVPSPDGIDDLSSDGGRVITRTTTGVNQAWHVVDLATDSVLLDSAAELRFSGLHEAVVTQTYNRHDETLLANEENPRLKFAIKELGEIVVSPGSEYVLSIPTADRLVLNSRTDGGQIIAFETHSRYASAAGGGFSGDARRLFLVDNAIGKDGVARIREMDLSPASWANFVCETVQRPLSAEEWTRNTGQAAPADRVCA